MTSFTYRIQKTNTQTKTEAECPGYDDKALRNISYLKEKE